MVKFPEFLKTFEKKATTFLQKGYAKDIEFSGPTYQVQVWDPGLKQDAWAFLQLDHKGNIQDCFCSCETEETIASCVHIATAFLRIYQEELPLHTRFKRSLWNKLCKTFSERFGSDTEILKQTGTSEFSIRSHSGKMLFEVRGKTSAGQSFLKEIIKNRRFETENTSLKFSNLSQEEILLWREGRPSSELLYELSFWTDLAKWFLLKQDEGATYEIEFDYSDRGLPNGISINFEDLEAIFYISESNLPFIIPALATVKSPLAVHNRYDETIRKITYDKETGTLNITPKEKTKKSRKEGPEIYGEGIPIDSWLFFPGDGFYTKEKNPLLDSPTLEGEQIDQALKENYKVIEKFLEGSGLHEEPIKASYDLSFDSKWNLHIQCYVHEKGDLTNPYSRQFGEWVYLNDDGFYHLEDNYFGEPEIVVPAEDISNFVTLHRSWLNNQEGFQTHQLHIEHQLTYTLDDDNRLKFDAVIDISEESEEHKDFGQWVYVAGEGFYSKISAPLALPVRPGQVIDSAFVPIFIKMNRDELKVIPNFFSEKSPISRTGLHIEIGKDNLIHVTPHHDIEKEFQNVPLRFFDEVVYIPEKGFYELPLEKQLPEDFQHPVQIEMEDSDPFIENVLVTLRKQITFLDPKLTRPKKLELLVVKIDEAAEGKDWEMMSMFYQSEMGKVPVTKLWQAFTKKRRFLWTDAGLIDFTDERFQWLKQVHKDRVDTKKNIIKLNTMELLRLDAFENLETLSDDSVESKHTRDLLHSLREFVVPEPPDLHGLTSHLRPYQEQGVHWLWFLYNHGLSGLLCDDMGLGKTHQAMGLMAGIRNHTLENDPTRKVHFLVICPTSVIYHWQDKLQEFMPGIRVLTYHGIDRHLLDFHQNYDVLLTSYGIWRNDNAFLNQLHFDAAICDEVQVAKNNNSQVYAALLKIKSKIRLGLTGTPIENHLRELKSLFDIILPYYMPGDMDYRQFFIKPIEKFHDERRKKLLSRFIKPFVTRRKKEEVLDDLPEKIEEVAHCTLLPEQQKLYQEVLINSRQKILDELKDQNTPIPFMHIFALLAALKQICDHPAVYLKTPHEYKKYQSGKWELFVELLSEARESRQKVVIFSQYLNMLDIIEDYLKEKKIDYATIRGSTTNRGEQVKRFNQDPRCEVFLGSLQAAGLGIDLTAGSVVIHYDRWWNAARENQATDRVHRIGQKRGVQVFKLVTKGTFEERIDALIERKGKLMEEVVGVDEVMFIKKFDREEIIQLLKDVDVASENVHEPVSDED